MIWKDTHLSVCVRPHRWQWASEQRLNHEVEGSACRAQRQDCVLGYRSGEGYKKKKEKEKSAVLKVPESTVVSINLKWKKFGRGGNQTWHLELVVPQEASPVSIDLCIIRVTTFGILDTGNCAVTKKNKMISFTVTEKWYISKWMNSQWHYFHFTS